MTFTECHLRKTNESNGGREKSMEKTFALAVFAWLSLSVLCGAVILYGSHAAVPVSKAYSTVSSGYSSSYSSGSSTSQPSSSKPSATVGEQNALKSAKRYLNSMPFSKKGLIEQLEYEGYSTAEATYGAENSGADWNANAAKKAKQYLDFMGFSRQGLIDQLEYEGYTHDQAVYGVTQNGY